MQALLFSDGLPVGISADNLESDAAIPTVEWFATFIPASIAECVPGNGAEVKDGVGTMLCMPPHSDCCCVSCC